MTQANLIFDRDFQVGDVPRRLFGSFVEHMGRCVYTGIYEPGHPTADHRGFRQDVLALVRELGVTAIRYPGGNFVSGYHWEDGVGPRDQRPARLDAAWHSIETNAFGLHEFADWAASAGVEVIEAVNLGTRGIDAARQLVEYANHPGGTELSDRRITNGAREPFGIRTWCLGNELDGPWQLGHKTADEYGRIARETARAMRLVDTTIELIAVGSSNAQMPTFGEWERIVLEHCYDEVDYISLHAYYGVRGEDPASFLASAVGMDAFIEGVAATVDAVRAKGRFAKRVDLAFDEWNVWHIDHNRNDDPDVVASGPWQAAPRLIEDQHTIADAVVVGTLMHSLLRHSDRVRIANQAQLVNVIAPILTEPGGPAWRQASFWPFQRIASTARGRVLAPVVYGPVSSTLEYGDAPLIDAVACWDEAESRVSVYAANRSQSEAVELSIDIRGIHVSAVDSAEVLAHDDPKTTNRAGAEPLRMQRLDARLDRDIIRASLPPVSWSVLQFTAD